MIKTKKVDDINIYFLFVSLVADILYIVYGALDNNTIMTISSLPPTVSHSIITFLWFYYQNYLPCKYIQILDKDTRTEDIII